jgi:hypothetical protein
MAAENRTWGEERIAAEILLKLSIRQCMTNSKIREHSLPVVQSCSDPTVRDLAVLFLHLLATLPARRVRQYLACAKTYGQSGRRSV